MRDVARLPGDEAGLILGAQAGDREAFASLVERYWDRLHRWLCHLTRDGHAARGSRAGILPQSIRHTCQLQGR